MPLVKLKALKQDTWLHAGGGPTAGGICFEMCNYVDSEWLVVGLMALAFFGKGVGSLGWAVVADTAPREVVGHLLQQGDRVVCEAGRASTSTLQRRLRIGYGRAAHLIDLMEKDGIVGPPDGTRPRELLKGRDWMREFDESQR